MFDCDSHGMANNREIYKTTFLQETAYNKYLVGKKKPSKFSVVCFSKKAELFFPNLG